ncbi:hypothetical protein FXN63_14625 [Pigmentiphaga aceris]|uniref:DUF4214 domain-containing protein n=1 Tax=Pigmentiphaga aceris TaxID=1940612 RepID=A0A5C0AZS6_9BURK|nr:hypothetical protein [Pigmentiphaga aceris]QEI06933.1 hypothetical protein FXN63_14625 [Pigmentiphaga aceris]
MNSTAIQTLYIALYGRPADANGLAFWSARLDALGGNLAALGAELATDGVAEFTATHGGKDFGAILATAYLNLFGRAADANGAAFWQATYDARVAAGDTPAVARASVLAGVAAAASSNTGSADAATLAARLDVAQTFTNRVFDNAVYVADLNVGRTLIASVTAANVVAKRDEAAAKAFDLVKLPANAQADVQALYIAWYGRPADQQGLAFWSLTYGRLGGDKSALAAALGNAAIPEFAGLHAGQDFPALLATVYENLFDRAPDAGGAAFWLSKYTSRVAAGDDAGTARIAVIADVMGAALANGGNAADQATLQARLTVANIFTGNLPSGTNYLATLQVGRDFLAGVTAANAAAKAVEAVTVASNLNGQINPGNPPSAPQTQTLSLTANADALTSTATGTVTFSAPLTQDNANTLSSGDVLDGRSAQQASLVATLFSNNGLLTVAPSLTDIGTVQLDTSGNGDVTLNLGQSTGVQTLKLTAAANTTVNGMNAIAQVALTGAAGRVMLQDMSATALDLSIAGAQSGQIFLLDNGSALKAMTVSLDHTQASVTLAGGQPRTIDTLTINSRGTSGNVLSMFTGTGMAVDVGKVLITGSADLRLAGGLEGVPNYGSAANISEFDASAATGNIIAKVASTGALTLQTGNGNDQILASAAGIATIDLGDGNDVLELRSLGTGSTVNGGAGRDTLTISTAAALSGVTVSGFEVLGLDTAQGTFDIGAQTWAESVRISGTSTSTGADAVLTNVASGVAVEITAAYVKSLQLSYATATDAVVTLASANTTNIDKLGVTTASPVIKIAADGTAPQYNIASLDYSGAAPGQAIALTLTGSARVVINQVQTNNSGVWIIDATGLAGGLDITLGGSGGVSDFSRVAGSAKNDNVVINRIAGSQVLDLGAGDDTVTYGSILNQLGTPTMRMDGGAGADTFDVRNHGDRIQFYYDAGDSVFESGSTRKHDVIQGFRAGTGSGSNVDQIIVDARGFTGGSVAVTDISYTRYDTGTNAAKISDFFQTGTATGVFSSDPASNVGVAVLFEAAASTGSGNSTWIAVDLNRDGNLTGANDLVVELLGMASNSLFLPNGGAGSALIRIDPASLVP